VGLAANCGASASESCCATRPVDGGSFYRSNDTNLPKASITAFKLDRFEVSVGRFRKFVESLPESAPSAGDGAHPQIKSSGWQAAWLGQLPGDRDKFSTALFTCYPLSTWTAAPAEDAAASQENLPVNCVTWYDAFAFCAWDGGRLPTETEWNFAAAGGDQQRAYPWSSPPGSTTIDVRHASYDCLADGSAAGQCALTDVTGVGVLSPTGDGRWEQADLAGNVAEWTLDSYAPSYAVSTCNDCADLSQASPRVIRGGSFESSKSFVESSARAPFDTSARDPNVGFRCAR
jgi:formylglycine-generating enzyme required for sulfatase activity